MVHHTLASLFIAGDSQECPGIAQLALQTVDFNLGASMRYSKGPNIYMRAQSKSFKMAVTLVIVYLVCWVPYYLVRCVPFIIYPCLFLTNDSANPCTSSRTKEGSPNYQFALQFSPPPFRDRRNN